MRIMPMRSRAHRKSCGTVPAKSLQDSMPVVFLFKPVGPAAPIYNELPLLVCLFKKKKEWERA